LKRLCIGIPELASLNGCAKDYQGAIDPTPPIFKAGLNDQGRGPHSAQRGPGRNVASSASSINMTPPTNDLSAALVEALRSWLRPTTTARTRSAWSPRS
jgi:hypothetical protein